MKRRTYIGFVSFVMVCAVLLPCTDAHATATINISIVPGDFETPVALEIVAPDGSSQTMEITDPDVVIEPQGGPGTYRISMTMGEKSAAAEVVVPQYGQVDVTFDTDSTEPAIFVDEPGPIENIMVTARRVEESMQRVPVAISAFTEKDIDNQHITNIHKLAINTPNLWMEKNTSSSSGARAAIRGIGEDESMFTSDTPVGIYIDDIYIPRQLGAMFDLYDVERLEVLRGPQGTLYGRNTSAGAIKLITRRPGEAFSLNLNAEIGNYDLRVMRGSVAVPVSESFRFQIAGMFKQRDGFDTNLFDNSKVNDQDIWGLRGTLEFLPSDRLRITMQGDVLTERSTPGYPLGFVPQAPFINGFGVGRPDFNDQLDGDRDAHTLLSDVTDPLNDLDQSGLSANISWQLGDRFELKSITAWREMTSTFFVDGDGQVGNQFLPPVIPTFLPLFHIFQDQAQDQFSQEFQGTGSIGDTIDYVAGLYYFQEKNTQTTENVIFAPFGFNRYTETALDTTSYALYGSFDFQLAENLSLTAGGRWTDDTKDFDITVFNADGSPMVACVGPDGAIISSQTPCDETAPPGSVNTPVDRNIKESWGRFTPRLALAWNATPDVLAYADISTGFKSGAFDGRANEGSTVLPLEAIPPEDIRSYEIGVKADLFNRMWRINVAAFLNDFDDLQGTGTDPDGNFIRFSLGDVQTSGAEIETIWVPINGLQLNGNIGLLETKFTKKNFQQEIDCAPYGTGDADLELKYSPKTSYRIGALYSTPPTVAGGSLSFTANYSYKARHFLGFCNAAAQTQVAYGLVDGVVAWETASGRWRFALTGANLTDEDYIAGVFAIPGLRIVSGYIGSPKTYSLDVKFRF